ncbi:hypothetical protein ACFYPK_32745 [Streptomyces halstedii]|uniref:hypothetical protein n=1 Tax=Streptomyces halstedii TaxID=1944 RepID=UPI00345FEA55
MAHYAASRPERTASTGPLITLPLRLTITEEISYSWRHNIAVPSVLSTDPAALAAWLTQHEDAWAEEWDPSDADTAEHDACSRTVEAAEVREPGTDPDRFPLTAQEYHHQALDSAAYAAMFRLQGELGTLRMTTAPHASTRHGAEEDRDAVASWEGPIRGDVTIINACRFLFHLDSLTEQTADVIAAEADELCDQGATVWQFDDVYFVQIGELDSAEAVAVAHALAQRNTPAL